MMSLNEMLALRLRKSPLRGREIRISVWDKPTRIDGLSIKAITRPVIAAFKRHRQFAAGGILEFTDADGRDFAVADQDIEAGRVELDWDGKLPAKAETVQ